MNKSELIKSINQLLADYESESGIVVKDICLNRIEVTAILDQGPKFAVTVEVETERLPGNSWAV